MVARALVLNELSLTSTADPWPSARALDEFSAVLASVRALAAGSYLVSPLQLWGHGVNAHASLGPWAGDPLNRDKLRQILAVQNRAPFESEFGVLDEWALEEYSFQGDECIGLGYAHRLDLLALSVPTRAAFDAPWLDVQRDCLLGDPPEISSDSVRVRHASLPGHVAEHRTWIVRGPDALASGGDLWSHRGEWFPSIDFLERVEADLSALEGKALRSVHEKLKSLQTAIEQWDVSASPVPHWRTKVTPESASRIAAGYCAFEDQSGTVVNFSLHARYTPGPGRIHFDINAELRRLRVAYIGAKRQ